MEVNLFYQEAFETKANTELVNVTERVRKIVVDSGVPSGLCIVYSPHTTAGITLNSSSDPATAGLVQEDHLLCHNKRACLNFIEINAAWYVCCIPV